MSWNCGVVLLVRYYEYVTEIFNGVFVKHEYMHAPSFKEVVMVLLMR